MTDVTDINGVGPSTAETLEEEGYESVEDIAHADPGELSEISGISEDRALEFMVSAGDLLDGESDEGEDDEPESDEFDLTPDEVGEELQEEDEDDGPEVEVVEEDYSDEGDEVDEEPTYDVSVDFNTRLQYHTFHAAVMRYHETQYTSNQPKADAMQKVLDGLDGLQDVSYDLNEEEFNTLHTAVKQARTNYQGDNLISHMEALNTVEEQINEQRRDYLF